MVNISEPTYAAQVPPTFIAHGCYSYPNKRVALDDTAEVPVNKVPRTIDVTLFKVTSSGTTTVATNKDVSKTECNGTRWRTSFTAPGLTGNDHYKITVTKTDTDGSTETAELSPFYVVTGAEQAEPLLCLCADTSGDTEQSRSAAFVGIAAGESGNCCGTAPRPMYPTRYDGFDFYRPDMKHAVCVVFDPRPGPASKGTVSITPAEFSMGHCAAFVPIPADAGAVSYAYRFLLLDETKTLVLHQSRQRSLS